MGPITYKAVADLRRHWRTALVLTMLLGLSGGVVLAAAAGARRTASAYPRLLQHLDAGELLVSPNGGGTGTTGFYDALEELDGVRSVGAQLGLSIVFHPDSEHGDIVVAGARGILEEDGLGYDVDRPKLLAGRMPAPDALDEVLVNRVAAEGGVSVGDRVRLALVDISYFENFDTPVVKESVDATVVGIGVLPDEVVPYNDLVKEPWLTVTPALTARAVWEDVQFEGAAIDTEPGTDLDSAPEQDPRAGRGVPG